MGIPSNPVKPGTTVSGKISWFNDGQTASGANANTAPGIALYNRATLGGYWLVNLNGHQAVEKQIDLGPAPWTGRLVDFGAASLGRYGYNGNNFPTDSTAKLTYLGQTVPANYQSLVKSGGSQAPSTRAPAAQAGSAQVIPTTTFDKSGYNAANKAYIAGSFVSQLDKSNPYNIPVKGEYKASDPLLSSGVLSTTPPDPANFTTQGYKLAQNTLQSLAGNKSLNVHPGTASGGAYVNPIKGFSIGRTDQGVDASAAPGTPIRAIGDSKLVQTLPDWYAGQPLLLFQFLNGPKAGQYWYVAEQISPKTTQIGHVFHAGEPVATFASSGTGIEIGYGSPTSNARTLADQQGNTGDASHNDAPAGIAFRQFLDSLH